MPFLQGFCRCSLWLVQLHSAFSHVVALELRRSPSLSPSRHGTPSSSSAPYGRPPTAPPARCRLLPSRSWLPAWLLARISAACNMTWPPAARLTRRTAPCSACSSWPRKHSARRASPPCNETSLCRSRCKKNGPRLCSACFFMASGRSRLFF